MHNIGDYAVFGDPDPDLHDGLQRMLELEHSNQLFSGLMHE
jgi:hypothetical protein